MSKRFTSSITPRRAGIVLLVAAIAGVVGVGKLQTAQAAGGPTIPKNIGGVVPLAGKQVQGSGDLTYHGGPTMTTNQTYAIYWVPSGSSMPNGYQSTIDQFFTDVAHDSNMSTNVYAADTQYYQNPGQVHIQYQSTFAGSVIDTNAFPASGCNVYSGVTRCLTDAQIQTEILNVAQAHNWTINGTNMFFMFTPQGLGSCFGPGAENPNSNPCAYTDYCAYHGTTSSGTAIYANQPYADVSGCKSINPPAQYPNGNPADSTINVTSHEHNEAITDPQVGPNPAWYDGAGYEIGDKCAWDFGTLSGSNGAEYNQTINGDHYFLQREYSNATHTCVQTYNIQGGGGGAPTVTNFSPTSGPVGTPVDITGTNFTGVTAVKFNGTAATSYTVNSSTDISANVPSGATTGLISVTNGSGTGSSSTNFTVTTSGGAPTVSSFSPTSGPVGTPVTINGTNFTGVTAVKFNGTAATSYTVNSSIKITANVPTGATSGLISVTNGSGTGSSSTSFTVTTSGGHPPTVTGFTPPSGPSGAHVLILGTNFTGATSVKLGGVSASFTVTSSTRITATVPTMSSGFYKWSVTTPAGTGTSFSNFHHY